MLADLQSGFRSDRQLTNGQIVPGETILGARIYQATNRLHAVIDFFIQITGDFVEADRVARVQNNLIHEIGHTIGLFHPNEEPQFNIDSDDDPFTEIVIADPLDPFAGLGISTNIDPNAIMRGGAPPDLQAFLFTTLQPDDASGRNVLYPVPAPEAGASAAAALCALGWLRRSRAAPRIRSAGSRPRRSAP